MSKALISVAAAVATIASHRSHKHAPDHKHRLRGMLTKRKIEGTPPK